MNSAFQRENASFTFEFIEFCLDSFTKNLNLGVLAQNVHLAKAKAFIKRIFWHQLVFYLWQNFG